MTEPTSNPEDTVAITGEDLEEQSASTLPDREAMSTISGLGLPDNFAMPINEAIALNTNTVSSYAIADADQIVIINQTDVDSVAD